MFDGLGNSNAIVAQAGHTNSAAALCLNSTNGGFDDWYLPSISELKLLWNNYFDVGKSIVHISGATQMTFNVYHSSTEAWASSLAVSFHFGETSGEKTIPTYVRAIRSF